MVHVVVNVTNNPLKQRETIRIAVFQLRSNYFLIMLPLLGAEEYLINVPNSTNFLGYIAEKPSTDGFLTVLRLIFVCYVNESEVFQCG